jgi:hypothetical protein
MIYKGLSFDIIFAENYAEVEAMKKAHLRSRARDDVEIDFNAMLKKRQKKIEKEEFISRVVTIQA